MNKTLVIEPADAVAHGMPPVRIAVDFSDLPLMARTFISNNIYAAMVGPPGGPLFFRIHSVPRAIDSDAALEALIRSMFKDEKNLVIGAHGEMDVLGQNCLTLLFFTGTSLAACANCALIVPPPDDDNGPYAPGVLFVFGHGGTPETVEDCLQIASCEPLGQILETIQVDFAAGTPFVEEQAAKAREAEEKARLKRELYAGYEPPRETMEEEKPARRRPEMKSYLPGVVLVYVGEIRETLQRMGCWSEGMPSAQLYASLSPLQQKMFPVQSTIQSVEHMLRGMAAGAPNSPVQGIVESLGNLKQIAAGTPEAAELLALLERGPKD